MTVTDLAIEADVDSWTPVNLNTLPEMPPVQPDLGGTGLVYPGKRHVFSGPPESAKTLAAYAILIQTVSTGDTVVLIDFEMGAYDARQRLRELGVTGDELDRILFVEPDQPATIDRIDSLVSMNPTLVVVDAAAGAYQLEGLDDNKRQDVEKIAKLYTTIFRRHGIATIMIDHVVKDAEMRGRFVIGSERKLGGSDVHLGFSTIRPVSRGSHGLYKITTHKDRGGYLKRGHVADLRLDSDPDTNRIAWKFTEATGEEEAMRYTNLMEKVSIDLETSGPATSRNELAKRVGHTKSFVLKAISALVEEGFATETDGPNNSRPVTSSRRYRENDADCNPQDASGTVIFHRPNTSGSEWFDSGSRTTSGSGGSAVRVPTGTHRPDTTHAHPPEQLGWFGDNGHLDEGHDAWLDTIAPDPDEDLFT